MIENSTTYKLVSHLPLPHGAADPDFAVSGSSGRLTKVAKANGSGQNKSARLETKREGCLPVRLKKQNNEITVFTRHFKPKSQ